MSHGHYPCPNRDLEAAMLFGKRNLRRTAKKGDPHSRRILLEIAPDEEARADLLVSWGVPLNSFDCLGAIQYA